MIKRHIDDGAAFDVVIVTRPVIDDFAEQGKIIPDTCIDIGRSGSAWRCARARRSPTSRTIEAFKRALLAAKSVVRSKDGTSGLYFEKLLDRLGIAEAMRGKIRLGPSGRVAELSPAAKRTWPCSRFAELLPVTGAEFVGPFPPELQLYTVFSAGVGTAAKIAKPPRPSSTL